MNDVKEHEHFCLSRVPFLRGAVLGISAAFLGQALVIHLHDLCGRTQPRLLPALPVIPEGATV